MGGGLVRELGYETLLLHFLRILEDCFAEVQDYVLKTRRIPLGFVEIYDVGNYGLVPGWLQRGYSSMGPMKQMAAIFDNIFPERVRTAFIVRAPRVFAVFWRITLPLVPETTKLKLRLRGHHAQTWLEEMFELLPRQIVPLWLQDDDPANFLHVKPWGGIVPPHPDAGETSQTAPCI